MADTPKSSNSSKPAEAPKPQESTPQASQTPAPSPSATNTEQQPVPAANAMSDAERAELEQFRAEKAAKDAAHNAAYLPDGSPNLDLDPRTQREAFLTLSIEHQIWAHYLHARGTIQDYARIFKFTVEEVTDIINKKFDIGNVKEVETTGDLIGEDEIGPGDTPIAASGKPAKANYSTN